MGKKGLAISREDIARNLGKASKSFLAANPHLAKFLTGAAPCASAPPAAPEAPSGGLEPPKGKKRKIRRSPEPKTRPEREMMMMLQKDVRERRIEAVAFEGVTMEAGDGMRYTPDFSVTNLDGSMRFVEVKGAYIRRTGLQAFQAARKLWPRWTFELWQLDKGEWKKLS